MLSMTYHSSIIAAEYPNRFLSDLYGPINKFQPNTGAAQLKSIPPYNPELNREAMIAKVICLTTILTALGVVRCALPVLDETIGQAIFHEGTCLTISSPTVRGLRQRPSQ